MYTVSQKLLSLALSLVMLLAFVPAVAVRAESFDSSNTVASVLVSGNVIRASYTTSDIVLNGIVNEGGWLLITEIGDVATAGAQWDFDNLYLAVRNTKKLDITITLNGVEITEANATVGVSKNKQNAEYKIPLKALGITLEDFKTKIAATIRVGSSTWEGDVHLSSIEWFAADNETYRSPHKYVGRSGLRLVHASSSPTGNQNVQSVTGGYNMYDRYSATSRNPLSIHTSLIFEGDLYAPFGDRTADTIVEFDFLAESMPVYKLGTDNAFYSELSISGFSWYMTDASDHFVLMGIVNTDIGLVFVLHNMTAKDNGPIYSRVLNKQLGEKFRVGTSWTAEGDIVLYVDGEVVDVIEDAESTHRRVTYDNRLAFNVMRSDELPKSEKDNFEIFITNLARGKYYGEELIDTLGFHTIQKDAAKNPDPHSITGDLTLPKSVNHPIFGKTLALTWESSDSSVIDPATGKVTRPAENGKTVTLTATDSTNSLQKSFELYVKGLAPTSDVLAVLGDIAAQKGRGTVQDVHLFTFDTNNNSIIRDLKVPTKVNVIALKDSDDINKLNETMLTIWVSDDNKTYEQLLSFKMLKDGVYTYLYDFEATARYVKVHCTNFSENDCDFIAPLDEMIEVYYENVFASGNSPFTKLSRVTVKNDTDVSWFDYIFKITPEDAGVKCALDNCADVRFYLDGELLYHYYDGESFFVRITKVPHNAAVTLKILSGNASAADITNKQNVYEIVHGTIETDKYPYARYATTLPNGRVISFHSGSNGGFTYYFSNDNGRSWTDPVYASGSENYLWVPQGDIYDEVAGRLIVSGYHYEDEAHTIMATHYMYSDNMGRTWQKAPITQLGDYHASYVLSYCDIIKLSSYDGEDGPNVDFVQAVLTSSPTMIEHYDNGYNHYVARVAYTTDGGKTWSLGADEVAYYDGVCDGDHAHTREHGTCEQTILEAKDGTVVLYMRCQYDNVYTLARAFSYDHGLTWTDAELSDVYSVNTQPYLFNHDENQFMVWGGNNMFGQGSFRRYPLNVAVSYDNLVTFENILDMVSKTAFQGMITTTRLDVTNPQLTMTGGSMLLTQSCSDKIAFTLRVDDFTDYFFKTRGAYDDFENTSAEWEGWAVTGGEIGNSEAQASAGKRSMYFNPGSSAVRSVPYLRNGTVSFDIFIEDVDSAKLEIELESAFGVEYGIGAPIAFELTGSKALFLGASSPVTPDLKDGWNTFTFNLALMNETPSATLSVNGSTQIDVPVDAEIGDYVCYVHISCHGALTYYLDEFFLEDMDNAYVPDIVLTADTADLTEFIGDFDEIYNTTDEMIAAMQTMIVEDTEGASTENTAVYTLTPKITLDGGETWRAPSVQDIGRKVITVKIPYPTGTSASKNDFKVLALYEKDYEPYTKLCRTIECDDGLLIHVKDGAPIVLAWMEAADADDIFFSDTDENETSSLLLYGGIAALVLAAAAAVAVVVVTVRKKKA